jgi:nucleotide-binding universal stress UspA family protein
MRRPIVAGVDGSPDGLAAAHYAASLAQRRGAPLLLISVFETLFYGYGPLMVAASYAVADEQLRKAAEESLEAIATEIRAAYPSLTVEAQLRHGLVASILIAESQEALATVVGSRGMGGFEGLLLGSVSSQVAAHAHGPVVVVRPAANPDGPILVGYDGSEAARAALGYAVDEALAQGKRLVAANVYWEEPWGLHHKPTADPHATALHKAEELIAEGLEDHLEAHPELQAETRTIHSLNEEFGMTEEAANASLVVVGCRGRGGFAGLLLGSVSQALVHHAACPVVVIHPTAHD